MAGRHDRVNDLMALRQTENETYALMQCKPNTTADITSQKYAAVISSVTLIATKYRQSVTAPLHEVTTDRKC
jgi:hypothetical protein